jgi:hypothetical protein
MTKQLVDQGKFNMVANIMIYSGLIGGLTTSLVSLYLLRRHNHWKKIYIDDLILNKPQNVSILNNTFDQLYIDNITQKHRRDIINMQNDIQKSTKENKILETKLTEKSRVNKIMKYKLIELEKKIDNHP